MQKMLYEKNMFCFCAIWLGKWNKDPETLRALVLQHMWSQWDNAVAPYFEKDKNVTEIQFLRHQK